MSMARRSTSEVKPTSSLTVSIDSAVDTRACRGPNRSESTGLPQTRSTSPSSTPTPSLPVPLLARQACPTSPPHPCLTRTTTPSSHIQDHLLHTFPPRPVTISMVPFPSRARVRALPRFTSRCPAPASALAGRSRTLTAEALSGVSKAWKLINQPTFRAAR